MPLGPEDEARHNIDDMLAAAGWAVQDPDEYDPAVAERGIAVREYPFESGPADYLLVVDREAVGVVEAKPEGTTLGGIAEQSQKYATSDPKHTPPAQDPMTFEDLEDFLECYNPENRHEREETERFKPFEYDEIIERDKTNLDIFWLKDDSLEDTENLPEPDVLASDIVENLGSALDKFRGIQEELEESAEV